MYLIGYELENKNKKTTIFLCTEFRNLYPDEAGIDKKNRRDLLK